MSWLALDIGGANIKLSDGKQFAYSQFFPLWQQPELLASELARLIHIAPIKHQIAVTMTGELADCFATKAEGVRFIVQAVCQAVPQAKILVYLTSGKLVEPEVAEQLPLQAAASNWHALASYVAQQMIPPSENAVLLDFGSTTCDILPLANSRPVALGQTDAERLAAGELVYTGVSRTPVCAQTKTLVWRGQTIATAKELFATTLDAYLMTGELPEDETNTYTADGKPATKEFACRRLARMLCMDTDTFNQADALSVANQIAELQMQEIETAAQQVLARMSPVPSHCILSGEGEFLLRKLFPRFLPGSAEIRSLTAELGPSASRCAPAYALAVLARNFDT